MSHARHEKVPAPVAAGVSRSTRPAVARRALVHFDATGICDCVLDCLRLEGAEEHSGGFAKALWEIEVSPRAAFRLVLAGRILRLRGHVIACRRGEQYPLAVLRALLDLPDDVREVLRSEVNFLESLGPYGAPSETIRERWSERLTKSPSDHDSRPG